jgi:hypothetical protein
MDKSKLVVTCDRDYYKICWYFEDDQDYGETLGPEKINDREHDQACEIAGQSKAEVVQDVCRLHYAWKTESAAKKVLSQINKVLQSQTPWPDWALKAQAEGWKAPKGWKPS